MKIFLEHDEAGQVAEETEDSSSSEEESDEEEEEEDSSEEEPEARESKEQLKEKVRARLKVSFLHFCFLKVPPCTVFDLDD